MSLYFEWRKSCGCRVPCNCEVQPKSTEPRYYFTQADEMLAILADTPTQAIELDITTFLPNETVKLDAMIEAFILTENDPNYSFIVEFSLLRETTPLTSESFALINQMGKSECEKTIINTTKITWTDIVPLPGTYTYFIEVNHITLPEQHIASVEVQDRSLTAITFPPRKEPNKE
ncbi:hypothetical protein AB685_08270 [Bacillus sp. LL01]|uniref:hypothetical protein n=1 Tax=Bacillus sp. LL01 TaxID=1665556 RepID=UPI00064D4034|nr:hypothetical protein [Bacillus sp. LL01]KMJ59053.1 hypothetical protein AB685_08270 [Bacillus sp. LL01]